MGTKFRGHIKIRIYRKLSRLNEKIFCVDEDQELLNLYILYKIQYHWNKRSVAPRPSPQYECGKRNPLYPIWTTSFVSIVLYLTCTIRVLLKKTIWCDIWSNSNFKIDLLIYISPIECAFKEKCQVLKDLIWFSRHFQQYFSYIMATSFSGGRSRSTRRAPPTMGKQLVNFITFGCESSAPFL
jgi:hypothetical protein